MRLIRLRVRNIASLKGEHEIDFSEIERGSPLFAITGETGSGKSTILNTIGLALYGEIYKKNLNQVDVVTLGEKEGSIELIFQVKGSFYLADWRARVLKQNGEPYSTPQSPVRNLYKIEGQEFTAAKTIANTTAEALLNLDFDQYCRCIILNQGEFAKFLNSTFKDRRDILEKLYPGEVLDNISRELELEKKTLEKSKQEIDIQLSTLRGDTTSGEELKKLKKNLEEELALLETVSKTIEDIHYHFTSMSSYHEKFLQNEKTKEAIREVMVRETTKFNGILKLGEAILTRFEEAKKVQTSELPLLETYLKKEETLRHLEEGWLNHKKKFQELERSLLEMRALSSAKDHEERASHLKLQEIKSALTQPIDTLKSVRPYFETLFELFSDEELIREELKGKLERLTQLEVSGKELKGDVEAVEKKLSEIPPDIEKRRTELGTLIETKKKEEMKALELRNKIQGLSQGLTDYEAKLTVLGALVLQKKEELTPIETTLKLQEFFSARDLCLDHAINTAATECPVCEQTVNNSLLQALKEKLSNTDLKTLRERGQSLEKEIQSAVTETQIYDKKTREDRETLARCEKELSALKVVELQELEAQLDVLKEQSWVFERLTKELTQKKLDLQRFREQYLKLKTETAALEKNHAEKKARLSEVSIHFSALASEINKDSIRDLRNEARQLNLYLEHESKLEKLQQELSFVTEKLKQATIDKDQYQASEEEQLQKITGIKTELEAALQGKMASELIAKINQEVRESQEAWAKHSEEEKKQGHLIRESQGRLGQLEELTKDFDVQFKKELEALRSFGAAVPDDLAVIKSLDLSFASPRELFVPIADLITEKKNAYKQKTNECRMNFSAAQTRLTEWEKLQDKILLLELKAKDLNDVLSRKMRLFEVLGKDELRTFVLSLVEENLIQQTNDELQKLCQGRYEIVHQTKSMKMTPEFFILDKFREGGKRKVSTLSGGETFMVSLAMALGLAEMTRGQAEIDSLFIDEGFGTLDQDSLEDVLDMLQQIQNRGLMVGVISHIKTLTSALPVNLVLQKKQDGTSTTTIQYN